MTGEARSSGSDESFEQLLREVARAPSIDPDEALVAQVDLVGRTLAHFRVVERIGAGGMGVVYRAIDEKLQRPVALKVLSPRAVRDREARELLLREARSAAAVNHPNIAAVYEVGEAGEAGETGETGNVSFIAMELVEGTTLRAQSKNGPIAPDALLHFATEIARGLARAHKQGIVHRDLKPDNVMTSGDGQVKILDFGLAKAVTSGETSSGQVAGTPAYMSPEQAMGAAVDARSDVFSFGVMLVELATGTLPEGVRKRAPAEIAARAPMPFAPIVARCLQHEPADRFADGDELLAALRAAMPSAGETKPAPTRRKGRVFPLVVAAGAAVVVTATVAIGVSSRRARDVHDPRLPASSAPPPVVTKPTPTLRRLTANIPADPIAHAALSPDGKSLAWSDATGLYVQTLGAPAPRAIELPSGGPSAVVAWTPSGKRLYASSTDALIEVDLATMATTEIAKGRFSGLAVAGDGKHIAFADTDRVGYLSLESPRDAHPLVQKKDGCFISEVAWSPDGGRIAYVSHCFDSLAATAIESVDLDGHAPQLALADPRLWNDSGYGGLVWTKAGELVYPLAEWLPAEPGSNLHALHVDPKTGAAIGSARQLTHLVGVNASRLSTDAEATRIAFVRFEVQTDVYLGALEDGGRRLHPPTRLTLTDRNERPSTFSRDGADVLFFTDRNGSFDLYAQAIAGGPARPLVATPAWETMSQLGPDGASLLFWQFPAVAAGEAVKPTLMRAHLDGTGNAPLLTTLGFSHPAGAGRPQPWEMRFRCPRAKDASCLLSERDGDALVFTALDPFTGRGKERFRFAHATAAQNLWDLSPDGRRLALPSANGPITVRTLEGGASFEVSLPSGCDPLVPTFASDGAGLFVSAECQDEAFRLYAIRFGEKPTLLWEDPPRLLLETEASPDGKQLAIAVKTSDDDVWMLQDW